MSGARPDPLPALPAGSAGSIGQALAHLHRLTISAIRSSNRQALAFRILNDSIVLVRYERASLWLLAGRRPRLLGVSGQTEVKRGTALAEAWARVVAKTGQAAEVRPVDPSASGFPVKDWEVVSGARAELAVLWVPLPVERGPRVGLWLDRTGPVWSDAEIRILQALGEGYAAAWDRAGGGPRRSAPRRAVTAAVVLVILAVAAGLLFRRVPLKVVAPCDVVALEPYLVTAPLSGVIEEVVVEPGAVVRPGDLLFRYDPRQRVEELEVARKQVAILSSQLDRAVVLAARGEGAQGELETLRNRLAQEQVRLRLAEQIASRLEVRAAAGGLVEMGPPDGWRGKPVQVGEKVLVLVDPARTRVRIWLGVDDNLPGLTQHPVEIYLHAEPREAREARLVYVANDTTPSAEGVTSYVAEADWKDGVDPPPLGLKGTAVLRGREVFVAEWIFRKPLVEVRAFIGW